MKIFINGTEKEIEEQSSLFWLVKQDVGDNQNGIAVAVNEKVIPKNDWTNFLLKEKDIVLVIQATQGG
jgi:sulfur carrier protein